MNTDRLPAWQQCDHSLFLPVDKDLSRKLADIVHAKEHQCWWNALRAQAQRTMPELRQADYVEGFVIWYRKGGAYYSHGWLELDGRIIDPTLILSSWWLDDYEVFVPAVRYTYKEALHLRKTVGTDHMPFAIHPSRDRTEWDRMKRHVHKFSWTKKVGGLRKTWSNYVSMAQHAA
jgi:hypothetical protein